LTAGRSTPGTPATAATAPPLRTGSPTPGTPATAATAPPTRAKGPRAGTGAALRQRGGAAPSLLPWPVTPDAGSHHPVCSSGDATPCCTWAAGPPKALQSQGDGQVLGVQGVTAGDLLP